MSVKTKVYSLLSLSADEVRAILPHCDVAPPVRRGDVLADIEAGYQCLVLVDGRFHHELAVSCDELMDALRSGLAVFGCSSMGALRAAELESYGMRGCGRVYEHIRSTLEFRDDLLGQTFAEDDGGRVSALSIPFVDLHFALLRLQESGVISRGIVDAIAETAARLHYTERTPQTLVAALKHVGYDSDEVLTVAREIFRMESQKRLDARATLALARQHLDHIAAINAGLDQALEGLRAA